MPPQMPPMSDPRRQPIRSWLKDHPQPTNRQLADAGYVAPHWPEPWGLAADPELQMIIEHELTQAGVVRPENSIAIGWAGPTIIAGGTEAQKQRWLPGILDGSDEWCQLFSEPEAGSDLAALRTRADRDGDEYIVNGQKIWSTWANRSRWGILLARTDTSAPKHRGISYFVLDMHTPGIEIRKIVEMTGGNHFNETFLTDVRIPVANRIGHENEGWKLAKVTLSNERVSLSEGGVLWGMGPNPQECFTEIQARGAGASPLTRQRAAELRSHTKIIELLGDKIVEAMMKGDDPGPQASIRKALADTHGQDLMSMIKDLSGPQGVTGLHSEEAEELDPWHWGYLFSRALTIGGGTSEVQRNIIGERLLGLPREPS